MKMQKLHIGYHKTGTTFLQSRVFPNVKNYIGRFYNVDGTIIKDYNYNNWTIETKLQELNNYNDIKFFSWEIFSKIPHDTIIKCFHDKKYNILITLRNQSDLLYSRYNHQTNFFLMKSINKFYQTGIITKNIIDYYNFTKLINLLRSNGHKVTYIWYEDLISLNKKAIKILSSYLEEDNDKIYKLIEKNLNNKINSNKKNNNICKINVDKYFNNSKLNYEDIINT